MLVCPYCKSDDVREGIRSDIFVCMNCGTWNKVGGKPNPKIVKLRERYEIIQEQLRKLGRIANALGVELRG